MKEKGQDLEVIEIFNDKKIVILEGYFSEDMFNGKNDLTRKIFNRADILIPYGNLNIGDTISEDDLSFTETGKLKKKMKFQYKIYHDLIIENNKYRHGVKDREFKRDINHKIRLIDKYIKDKSLIDYQEILIQLRSDLTF